MTSFLCIRGSVLLSAAFLVLGRLHAADTDAGLLGKTYVGASAFVEDVRISNIGSGGGAEISGNVPLTRQLDFGARASYEGFSDYHIRDKRLGAYLRGYTEADGFRPFVELGLGATWQSSDVYGIHYSSNDGIYTLGVGVEAPVAKSTALVGRVGYNKYFDSKNGHYWLYSIGVNHWLSPRLNAGATVNFQDGDSITYMITLNFGL